MHHQPALGDAVVAQLKTLQAGLIINRVPGVRCEGLPDHLGDSANGVGNTCDAAKVVEVGGIGVGVAFRVGEQIPRTGRVLKGGPQCLRPLLENLCVRGIAVPAFAQNGDTPILGHHECQHHLLPVRPVISGVAMGDGNGVLIPFGNVCTAEGKAGRVEMIAAQVDAFLGTDRQGQLLKQQVAAIGVGRIERATELKALEHLGAHACTQQQIEGFASKKLGGQGQRSVAKPEAIQNHPSYGFAGCDGFWCIGHETGIDQRNEA